MDSAAVQALLDQHAELENRLADPLLHADPDAARKVGRRYGELSRIVRVVRELDQARNDMAVARELAVEDPVFATEADTLADRIPALESELAELLLPRDPHDDSDVVLEIKSGEGGAESALFAADLLRMYLRYAERHGWQAQVLDATESDLGGYKDVTVSLRSSQTQPGVWERLKFEGGVHRVQRVPVTESSGRIHTSAAGVLVYPEPDDVEIELDDKDLRIDVYRSSGPGGQSVNTTDSAVRITHLPTGIVVSCQNEKSQIQNRAAAMRVLQSRLLERKRQEQQAELDALKGEGSSWGNQMRSYVLHPYQMVKDLRTGYEVGNPATVLDGDIDGFLEAGIRWRRQQQARVAS
ncbi:MAG: PCRF domain-containing protein [Pseudonocardiales bacterium]|nr:PCRF domain-containing protein [Pseudonocardiales bacterium]